ncbi:MAG: hypothetical protein U0Q16_25100 [Bryobacteraceae bacterium]
MEHRCGIVIDRRPLREDESADLKSLASAAVNAELDRQRAEWRRNGFTLALIAATYLAIWTATFRLHLDIVKTALLTAVTLAALAALAVWELRQNRQRIRHVKEAFAEGLRQAREVRQLDCAPASAWECGEGWIFDLGNGYALFTEQDPDGTQVCDQMSFRWTIGFSWTHSSGQLVECRKITIDWSRFPPPPDHPLLAGWGPAVFRLHQDPAASLRDFEEGWLPFPEARY